MASLPGQLHKPCKTIHFEISSNVTEFVASFEGWNCYHRTAKDLEIYPYITWPPVFVYHTCWDRWKSSRPSRWRVSRNEATAWRNRVNSWFSNLSPLEGPWIQKMFPSFLSALLLVPGCGISFVLCGCEYFGYCALNVTIIVDMILHMVGTTQSLAPKCVFQESRKLHVVKHR